MSLPEPTTASIAGQQVNGAVQELWPSSAPKLPASLPLTSPARLASSSEEKSILYLAYGSNLSAETFRGVRGIRPLSSVNVHVPSLDLAFDLPGLPYIEPCFANARYRTPPPQNGAFSGTPDYHKNRWKKGLVGVMYEVTPEDYRTIIATEGAGASYHDIIVPCFPLVPGLSRTPDHPTGQPAHAHTLLSPPSGQAIIRPDPSYAQPSPRYLTLLRHGAEEHELPADYTAYLYDIRGYTITTRRQRVGQVLFLAMWGPLMAVAVILGRTLVDKDGRMPEWLAKMTGAFYNLMWKGYDLGFKKVWGEGERTIEDIEGYVEDYGREKEGLIRLP